MEKGDSKERSKAIKKIVELIFKYDILLKEVHLEYEEENERRLNARI